MTIEAMQARNNPAIVLDNGTGLTKIGFAGAAEPLEILQSSIGKRFNSAGRHSQISKSSPLDNLDYVVGNPEFFSNNSNTYRATCPLRKNGIVGDWDGMEQLWTSCFYDKLRINPEDHYVLLTEQIYNTPDARAETAEIMFETFNVPALMISPQVVLSLAASWTHEKSLTREMTGVVVDSGVGSTRIVPIVDGNVMSGAIEKIDIGGTDVTTFIIKTLRQRKEPFPSDMAFDVAKDIKENYCYACPNIDKEIAKYDSNPEKYIKTYEGIHKRTKKSFEFKVAYERFLAPEMVMNTQLHDSSSATTLSDLVDSAIMKCPIDTRRALYSNIVLSGGNTSYQNFGRRLTKDMKEKVASRKDVEVNVIENHVSSSSVWLGGSILASTDEFFDACKMRKQYDEEGPRIFRQNAAFKVEL